MIVMKFGGTSLGGADRVRRAAGLVVDRVEQRPIVVLSAMAKVTNALIEAAHAAFEGQVDVMPLVRQHRETCAALDIEPELCTPMLLELKDLLKGISLVRELTPRSLDFAASFGERCSCRIMAAFLRAQGVDAVAYDTWDLGLATDSQFGAATPLPESLRTMHERLAALPSTRVPIVTGYIAKDLAGEITTLGRNGSDFTATLVGAAAGAREVQIWTDVDGVMTADPGIVDGARTLDVLTYHEAAELAYYGGRVLHPATLAPAMEKEIPVRVLNTLRPESPGTRIVRQRSEDEQAALPGPVRSIVYKKDQILIHIESARMLGQPGYMRRVFDTLGQHAVSVNMIATSEVSISMTTDSMAGLNGAVTDLGEFATVRIVTEKSIIGVVGHGIGLELGMAASILGVVREVGVPVELVSVGASKVNITFLVDNQHLATAVRALHTHYFHGL